MKITAGLYTSEDDLPPTPPGWRRVIFEPVYGGGTRPRLWVSRLVWLLGVCDGLLNMAATVLAAGAAMALVSGAPMSVRFRAYCVVAFAYLGMRNLRRTTVKNTPSDK